MVLEGHETPPHARHIASHTTICQHTNGVHRTSAAQDVAIRTVTDLALRHIASIPPPANADARHVLSSVPSNMLGVKQKL